MTDSEHEDEEHGETKQMSMYQTNWRRQSTSLSQLEIATINEYFNDLNDYVGSMTLVLKIAVMIKRFVNFHDTYGGMLLQVKEVCIRLCMMLIQLSLLTTHKMHENIIHVSPPLCPFSVIKNRFIDDLDKEWARTNTQFTKEELRKIYTHLRIPE